MLDADHHLKTMRTLEKIADAIWMRRQSINFGALQTWDESTFLQSWVDGRTPALRNNKPAWYWTEADQSTAEFATTRQGAGRVMLAHGKRLAHPLQKIASVAVWPMPRQPCVFCKSGLHFPHLAGFILAPDHDKEKIDP